MKGTPAIYLGRIVEKTSFRTHVYSPDGKKKLVESWDKFEAAMETGLWFATMEDAIASIPAPVEETVNLEEPVVAPATTRANVKSKSRAKAKPVTKPKSVAVEEVEEGFGDLEDETCFEVKGDLI